MSHVATKIKANIFWMGTQPLVVGKTYKLKLTTQHVPVVLSKVLSVLDASALSSDLKIKANIFWMGTQPLVVGKTYKLKLTTQHVPVVLSKVLSVLDASALS